MLTSMDPSETQHFCNFLFFYLTSIYFFFFSLWGCTIWTWLPLLLLFFQRTHGGFGWKGCHRYLGSGAYHQEMYVCLSCLFSCLVAGKDKTANKHVPLFLFFYACSFVNCPPCLSFNVLLFPFSNSCWRFTTCSPTLLFQT